ncbi:hypothetical protein [Burkholderia phage FLC6]|nr:hypothetical protein [Burkholderia phage FLC6]BDD79372.1 hypothetical protein [Burkholderia phage FLC8]
MNYDPVYTAGIQKAINEKAGQNLKPDGAFGPMSVAALRTCQAKLGCPVTGVYDAATSAILDPFIRQKYLTMASFQAAAQALGVTPAHVRTVCAVESNGAGFLPDGRVKILFERHWFSASLIDRKIPNYQTLAAANSDIINHTPGGYIGGTGEYPRLARAIKIDPYSAYYAASYGLFQIMGFNASFAGYGTPEALYNACQQSETNQLLAFVSFIKNYRAGVLWTALKAQDWVKFALNYNGSNYKANQYDTKLATNFATYTNNINAA